MAAATVTQERWGYSISGDTGAATVGGGGTLKIKTVTFSGNADNATGLLTSGAGGRTTTTLKFKTNGNDLDMGGHAVTFGDKGVEMENVIVTLSNASDHMCIFLV